MNTHFRVAGRLAQKLDELGVSVPAVLRAARLPHDLFEQARVLVTTEELFALWRAIGAVSTDPAIGLKLGTEHRTERFHPSGLAALSTPNFGAADAHMARYKQLVCPEEMLQEHEGGEWRIRFRWLLAVDAEPQVLTEYCFAWLQTIARRGSGTDVSPVEYRFYTTAAAQQNHRTSLPMFGSQRGSANAIVFRTQDAACPFITLSPELLETLAPQFEKELEQCQDEDSFTLLVRRTIQEKLTGHRPAIEDIARSLHMSSRTLQRRLQEAGSSYQRTLDEARHQMARYYLGNSVLELNEAAYLLGYEDAKSFVRAFRNWEGIPPGLWRETHRATAVS